MLNKIINIGLLERLVGVCILLILSSVIYLAEDLVRDFKRSIEFKKYNFDEPKIVTYKFETLIRLGTIFLTAVFAYFGSYMMDSLYIPVKIGDKQISLILNILLILIHIFLTSFLIDFILERVFINWPLSEVKFNKNDTFKIIKKTLFLLIATFLNSYFIGGLAVSLIVYVMFFN